MSAHFQVEGRPVAPAWFFYAGENRGLPSRRGRRCRFSGGTPEGGGDRHPFTVEEHLRVQAQIEKRAHEFWQEGGCRQEAPLSDWLRAESEVLREFCMARP